MTAGRLGVEIRTRDNRVFTVNKRLRRGPTSAFPTRMSCKVTAPTALTRRENYMSNIMYHLSPNLTLALEWRRFLTDYCNQPGASNGGDHFNFASAYTF